MRSLGEVRLDHILSDFLLTDGMWASGITVHVSVLRSPI